ARRSAWKSRQPSNVLAAALANKLARIASRAGARLYPKCPNSVYDTTKRFQAGWVSPMRILEDHKHRALPRQRLDLRGERLQRFLPALLRHRFEGGIPAIVRQRKHLGNECGVLDRGRSLREQSIELVEFFTGRNVM